MQGQVEEVSMEGCRRDDEVFVFVCGCEDDEGAESEGCEGGQEFCEEGYVFGFGGFHEQVRIPARGSSYQDLRSQHHSRCWTTGSCR